MKVAVEAFKVKDGWFFVQPEKGMVAVVCPWHPEINGVHYWTAPGDEGIYPFLLTLNKGYVMKAL